MDDSQRNGQNAAGRGVPFGRYVLLRKIATGGMAQLYLATMRGEADFQKLCVVKKILPHLSEQPHFVQMFLDEARIAARLNHPNIVQIYDLGRVGSAYFIAMEYIAGEDLARIFSRAREIGRELPVELCARIAADICAGLHYAHEQRDDQGRPLNIIHRDVSPQNVIVTYEGQVKIVDFGIAKAAGKTAHTRTGTIMGKAAYMSPEQCLGRELDRRSDIFAVGILLYELLTLTRLFKRPNDLVTMRAITEEDAPSVRERRPGVPERLAEIVARALERDRDKRYSTCLEMREELERFIADFGVPATSLELADLLEELFPDHVERRARIREAGSLSEVIRALPEAGLPDLGTPSAQASATLTETRAHRPRGLWWAAAALGAVLAGGAALYALWPRPPEWGRVVLTSTPSGARVELDGVLRGETPLTIYRLDLGRAYELRVAASGFRTHVENLYLTTDHPVLQEHVALEALPPASEGRITVVTSPPGAKVLLDGRDTGLTTPATLDGVAADVEHMVELRLRGYEAEQRRVLVRPGAEHRVEVALQRVKAARKRRKRPNERARNTSVAEAEDAAQSPKPSGKGFLTLRTRPWTRVYLGSVELGETPLFKVEVPAGRVKLRLVNPEKGIDRTIEVTIERDEVTTVDRKLR